MFNFFTSFVDKFITLVAGLAISVGLVSAPLPEPTPEIPAPIVEEVRVEEPQIIKQEAPRIVEITGSKWNFNTPKVPKKIEPVKEPVILALPKPEPKLEPKQKQDLPKEEIQASQFAKDFKLSYIVGTSSVTFIAEGYRGKESVRGWFKWWTINRVTNSVIVPPQRMDSLRLPAKDDEKVEVVQFSKSVPLNTLVPHAHGYTRSYFQFYFESQYGNVSVYDSSSEPVEIEF